jgi:hypothetical protein
MRIHAVIVGKRNSLFEKCLLEAVEIVPDARQAKFRGMRRTLCTLNDEG